MDDVINMDETGVWMDMASVRTIETVGMRQVPIKQIRNSKTRCTVVVSITATGRVLRPTVFFRVKRMTTELAAINQEQTRVLVQRTLGWTKLA